jgi:hypothetical protein
MSLRPNARVEVRKKGYKLAVDADEARRKREDGMVEIRKSKRDENLLKKRREGTPAQHFSTTVQTVSIEKKVNATVQALEISLRSFVLLLHAFARTRSFRVFDLMFAATSKMDLTISLISVFYSNWRASQPWYRESTPKIHQRNSKPRHNSGSFFP